MSVKKNMNTSLSFVPHPLLTNPHMQTLCPQFFLSFRKLGWRYECLGLPDGDFMELYHLPAMGAANAKLPHICLFHGLTGGLRSPYISSLSHKLHKKGFNLTFVYFRGFGPRPNPLPRLHHAADTADIAYLLKYLKKKNRDKDLISIGFSLGAHSMLKYLGEYADKAPFACCSQHNRLRTL